MVHSVQTVHLSCVEINTISKIDKNELQLDQRHIEVPSGMPEKDLHARGTFGANRAPILV
jgi:CDP-diacylglycerol pyrophosphatase